jgi:hypothetical protein
MGPPRGPPTGGSDLTDLIDLEKAILAGTRVHRIGTLASDDQLRILDRNESPVAIPQPADDRHDRARVEAHAVSHAPGTST